ncbi:hypothetical protein N431DRAFT_95676 [Stipitochalara longipes BDJ]|nr:hypothetical protein N431DRAFT_95676 [Stipitochalara longipes BDJ]
MLATNHIMWFPSALGSQNFASRQLLKSVVECVQSVQTGLWSACQIEAARQGRILGFNSVGKRQGEARLIDERGHNFTMSRSTANRVLAWGFPLPRKLQSTKYWTSKFLWGNKDQNLHPSGKHLDLDSKFWPLITPSSDLPQAGEDHCIQNLQSKIGEGIELTARSVMMVYSLFFIIGSALIISTLKSPRLNIYRYGRLASFTITGIPNRRIFSMICWLSTQFGISHTASAVRQVALLQLKLAYVCGPGR